MIWKWFDVVIEVGAIIVGIMFLYSWFLNNEIVDAAMAIGSISLAHGAMLSRKYEELKSLLERNA